MRLYNCTKSFFVTRNMSSAQVVEKKEEEVDDNKEVEELLEKYNGFLQMLDYHNPLYYGALLQQLFSDCSIPDEKGTVDQSIDDLSKLIVKAATKLNFDIYNASIKQLHKLFSALMLKLGGTTKLRDYDPDTMDPLLFRMYSDDETLELLHYFEDKGVNPENIIAVNHKDEVVFSNKKKYKLTQSSKVDEMVDFYANINSAPK